MIKAITSTLNIYEFKKHKKDTFCQQKFKFVLARKPAFLQKVVCLTLLLKFWVVLKLGFSFVDGSSMSKQPAQDRVKPAASWIR